MNSFVKMRQQKYTRNLIKNSFAELLLEHPLEKVTVAMLCRHADINRSTFYRYYADIYEMAEQIENDLFRKIFQMAQMPAKSPRQKILAALDIIYKNRRLCLALLGGRNNAVARQVLEGHLRAFKEELCPGPDAAGRQRLYDSYLVGGLANLWVSWLEGGCDVSREIVADLVEEILMSVDYRLFRIS